MSTNNCLSRGRRSSCLRQIDRERFRWSRTRGGGLTPDIGEQSQAICRAGPLTEIVGIVVVVAIEIDQHTDRPIMPATLRYSFCGIDVIAFDIVENPK
jgi:hypothetical protein